MDNQELSWWQVTLFYTLHFVQEKRITYKEYKWKNMKAIDSPPTGYKQKLNI
jgi:hypothetical protein